MSTNSDGVQPELPQPVPEVRPEPVRLPEAREAKESQEWDEDYERPPSRFDRRAGKQWQEDNSHLNILSILFYAKAALLVLTMSFFIIYIVMGIAFVNGSFPGPNPPPPALGWMFIAFGSIFVLFGWGGGVLLAIAGYCLGKRRAYGYCFVAACLACLSMPIGTVLGIFTIIVLIRPSVKAIFEAVGKGADPKVPPAEYNF